MSIKVSVFLSFSGPFRPSPDVVGRTEGPRARVSSVDETPGPIIYSRVPSQRQESESSLRNPYLCNVKYGIYHIKNTERESSEQSV